MSDSERMRDSSDPIDQEIASFLDEARSDVPRERLASVAERLGLGAGAAGDGGGSGGAGGSTAGAGAAKVAGAAAGGAGMGAGAKIAAGVLLGLTAVGVAVSWRASEPSEEVSVEAPAPAVERRTAPGAAEPQALVPSEPEEPAEPQDDAIAPPPTVPRADRAEPGARPSRSDPAQAAAVGRPVSAEQPGHSVSEPSSSPETEPPPATEPPPPPTGIAEPPMATEPQPSAAEPPSEASLLARARRALDSNPAAALAAVREHARLYPDGILAQEREVLRVETLVRLGRRGEARAALASFLTRWPGSPHRGRLRALVH